MFGKREKNTQPKVDIGDVEVEILPPDFYAGQDPVVKFKKVEQEVDLSSKKMMSITSSEKKALDKATVVGGTEKSHPVNLLLNRKFLILAGVGLFVLFVLVAGGYYWWSFRQAAEKQRTPDRPVINTEVVNTESTSNVVLPTTTPIETEVVTTTTDVFKPLEETDLNFPSSLLPDSSDLDKDLLTDREEEIFFTDPAVPDSDNDSYTDGHEVFYLYNPSGKEPQKLIDASSVREYANPTFGYRLYYPQNWAVGSVDQNNRIVVFSTLTGENIEVRVIDKKEDESMADWFGRIALGEKFTDLKDFNNRFNNKGLQRPDELVYYFPGNKFVVTIIYHPEEVTALNYRQITTLMAQSLQLPAEEAVLPPSGMSVTSPPNTILSTTTPSSTDNVSR